MSKFEKISQTKDIWISPEIFRIINYISILLFIGIAWVLTVKFSHVNFHDNPMVNAFGYNNTCVLFDFPPATYVLPILWAIVLIFWFTYLYTHWLRARFLIESDVHFAMFTCIIVIEFLAAAAFSIIFAVQPTENLTVHYAGFSGLIFAYILLALVNFIFFRNIFLDSTISRIVGQSYVVLAVIVGAIKLFLAINFLILGNPWLQPLGYSPLDKPTMIEIYLIIDRAWFLLFIVLPLLFSFYLYKKFPLLHCKVNLVDK